MDARYFDGLFALLLSLFGMFGAPMPMAVPPLPDDPALLHVVPPDAIGFLSWNGSATADPKSTNMTEQLAAEPEVRAMLDKLRLALIRMSATGGGELAAKSMVTALDALQHPGCVFLRRVGPRPQFEAGIVVHFGEAGQSAKDLLQSLTTKLNERGGDLHEDKVVDGVTFHAMGTDKGHPFVGWADFEGWTAFVIGAEMPAQVVAGVHKHSLGIEGNPTYLKLAPSCQVARPCTKAFVDLQKVGDTLDNLGMRTPAFDALMTAIGLQGASAIASQSGLEGNGFSQRVRLLAPACNGLLAAFGGQPLSQDELLHIPLDAQIAVAMRIDAKKIESAMVQIVSALEGRDEAASYEREFVAEFPRHMGGARWREDVLDNLGDQLTAWNAPSQGGLGFTGLTAILNLRNGQGFADAMGKVLAEAKQHMPDKQTQLANGSRLRRDVYLEQMMHGSIPIEWLDILERDAFVAPCWTVVGDHLFASLLPQPLKATIDDVSPNPDRSLVRLPAVNKRGSATAMFCWNARDLFALGYPLLLPFAKIASNEWQREGMAFSIADLPTPGALLPHLGLEVELWEPADQGYLLSRNGTIPAFDPLAAALIAAAIGVIGIVN